jgi:NADH:ubiquinone oxidoreductase subunit E
MVVDEDTHKQVKEVKLDQILKKYQDGANGNGSEG